MALTEMDVFTTPYMPPVKQPIRGGQLFPLYPNIDNLGEIRRVGNTFTLTATTAVPNYFTKYSVNVESKYITLLSPVIPRSSFIIVDGNQNRIIPIVPRVSILVNSRKHLDIYIADFVAVQIGTIVSIIGTDYFWLFSDELLQTSQGMLSLETNIDFLGGGRVQHPRVEVSISSFETMVCNELIAAKTMRLGCGRALGSGVTLFDADVQDYREVDTNVWASTPLARTVANLEFSGNSGIVLYQEKIEVSPTAKRLVKKVLNPAGNVAFLIEGVQQ